MGRIDENIAKIKDLQEKIDRRAAVEQQAVELICKGECEAAKKLLDSLSDELVKELAKGGANDVTDSVDKSSKLSEENTMSTTDKLIDKDLHCLARILQGYEYMDGDTFSCCKYCLYHEECDTTASKGYVHFTKTVRGKLQDITGVYLGIDTHDIKEKLLDNSSFTSIHGNMQ